MEGEFQQGQGENEEITKEALEIIWMRYDRDLSWTREGPQDFCISFTPFTKICKTFYLPKMKELRCYFLLFIQFKDSINSLTNIYWGLTGCELLC